MKINIALIGYRFMGKAHSYGLKNTSYFFKDGIEPVLKVICGRTEHLVKQAAQDFGWEEYATDWREVIKRDDIDVVDIVTPTVNHMEIALEAMKAGKHVFCEKPLAMDSVQAREMVKLSADSGLINMVGFNYRRVPAIALAHKMVSVDKVLGRIYHVRAVYLQDWIMDPKFPAIWKLKKEIAGSGPHGDLNAHIIDMARYITGDEIESVTGVKETFIKKRPKAETGESLNTMLKYDGVNAEQMDDVTVEDACAFLARFKNGALGTFEATRFAAGRKNFNRIEINGEKGTIWFEFEDMNRLKYFNTEASPETKGFTDILVTEESHPYISHWWPAGHIIGYENTFVNQFSDFFHAIKTNGQVKPDFYDGLRVNQVLDAVMKSTETGTWINVDDV